MGRLKSSIKHEIWGKDNNICAYCLYDMNDELYMRTIDHIKPRCEGGKNNIENIVTCCRQCNFEKSKTEQGRGSVIIYKHSV